MIQYLGLFAQGADGRAGEPYTSSHATHARSLSWSTDTSTPKTILSATEEMLGNFLAELTETRR